MQAVQKFHISVDAYRQMGYDAVGLGASDLQFSSGDLISVTASQGKQVSPFVCANVAMGVFDPALLQSYRVVKANGIRVGITGVLGQQYQKTVRNAEIVMASAETKLAEVFPKLQQEADYFILLAYATIEESTALAEKFPQVQPRGDSRRFAGAARSARGDQRHSRVIGPGGREGNERDCDRLVR